MDLTTVDATALDGLRKTQSDYAANSDIISSGEPNAGIHVIETGWAIRHKTTLAGQRVITNFVLPGDFVFIHAPLFEAPDHSVTAITEVTAARVTPEQFIEAMRNRPRLILGVAWCSAKEESLFQEHLLNIARRSAYERMAHLLIELWRRLQLLGLTDDGLFPMPVTQQELADSLGLSIWHVNRTIAALSRDRLIAVRRDHQRHIRILNEAGLITAAGFEDEYLHFTEMPARTARLIGAAD